MKIVYRIPRSEMIYYRLMLKSYKGLPIGDCKAIRQKKSIDDLLII